MRRSRRKSSDWLAGRIAPALANDHGNHSTQGAVQPEVELLFLPGEGSFSGAADCNLLVALDDSPQLRQLASAAHVVVAPHTLPEASDVLQFRLDQWDQVLNAVA